MGWNSTMAAYIWLSRDDGGWNGKTSWEDFIAATYSYTQASKPASRVGPPAWQRGGPPAGQRAPGDAPGQAGADAAYPNDWLLLLDYLALRSGT